MKAPPPWRSSLKFEKVGTDWICWSPRLASPRMCKPNRYLVAHYMCKKLNLHIHSMIEGSGVCFDPCSLPSRYITITYPRGFAGHSHTWTWWGTSALLTPVFEIFRSHWLPFYAQLDLIDPIFLQKKSVCLYHI